MAASTANGFNAKSPTIKRILQESKEMSRDPDPSFTASPLEDNLYEWHFTIAGPPSSPYESGIYHGRIILPPSYPLRPPAFRFMTPTGRFEVNREICLSISGHHEETWQPAWGIRTALCAIRAFMESDAHGQVGGIDCSDQIRRRMAVESRIWKCPTCSGGRTMEDIIAECKALFERAKASGKYSGGEIPANEIPQELRLAYKDELEKGTGRAEERNLVDDTVSPVGTVTSKSVAKPPLSDGSTSSASTTAITENTARRRAGEAGVPNLDQVVHAPRDPVNDLVPAWIDKAIFAVIVLLAFMLIKRMLV